MPMTFTHAAIVAGLAIMASSFIVTRSGLLLRLAAAVGLAVIAATIIHAVAS